MRLVVDTNVLISSTLKASSWPGFVMQWITAQGGLLKTADVEAEVFRVLAQPRIARVAAPVQIATLRQIFADAELVTITETVTGCRYPNDDKFLELAVNGQADFIVSGHEDLPVVIRSFRGIPIMTPSPFGRMHAG